MAALLLATLGNTLGGMTTYGMARWLPQKVGAGDTAMKRLDALRRHGAPLLLFAWTPIIGDALCAAAGWLRLPPIPCALWMTVGKAARYVLLVAGAGMV
jgi:membrane protein YqaA with SNARE-associated domain